MGGTWVVVGECKSVPRLVVTDWDNFLYCVCQWTMCTVALFVLLLERTTRFSNIFWCCCWGSLAGDWESCHDHVSEQILHLLLLALNGQFQVEQFNYLIKSRFICSLCRWSPNIELQINTSWRKEGDRNCILSWCSGALLVLLPNTAAFSVRIQNWS